MPTLIGSGRHMVQCRPISDVTEAKICGLLRFSK